MTSESNCPCCPNHCPSDNLGCHRGKEHFNNSDEPKTLNEQVISDLKKCGHLLHHNRDLDSDQILSNFSLDELNNLHELLSKIHSNI